MNLGRYGAWVRGRDVSPRDATEIEALGYGALWLGSSPSADLAVVEDALAATSTLVLATGIVNIWTAPAAELAASFHRVANRFPDRFLLGIGVGHREQITAYTAPYEALVRYLDDLDGLGVPASSRVLAALGPRVLRLAATRCAGAHPYLTTPAHTRSARSIMGPEALLAPEHKIVLSVDPVVARALGRPAIATPYLQLSNYVANLRRLGYSDDDVAGRGSDRLIDDLVAHGTAAAVVAKLDEHLAAGADHVAVQPIPRTPDVGVLPSLRDVAAVLF